MRSWAAREEWLALPDFSNHLHTPPYSVLLNCDSWQVRHRGCRGRRPRQLGSAGLGGARPGLVPPQARAHQSVREQLYTVCPSPCVLKPGLLASTAPHPLPQPASQLVFPSKRHRNKAVCAVAATAAGRRHVFTFCLERVLQGPLKNCWLTVGVREGDYANC